MTREIPLSQGLKALVDADDYDRIGGHKWYAHRSGDTFYAVRKDCSVSGNPKVWLHREILGLGRRFKVDPRMADHINLNGLDCRKSNLRIATHQQNNTNHGIRKDNKSGVKGVRFHKATQKWCAQIGVSGHYLHLGTFETIDEAHYAYTAAALTHHKAFANLT